MATKTFVPPVCFTKYVRSPKFDGKRSIDYVPGVEAEATQNLLARGKLVARIDKNNLWSKGENARASMDEYIMEVLHWSKPFYKTVCDVYAAYMLASKASKERMELLSDRALIKICTSDLDTDQIDDLFDHGDVHQWTLPRIREYICEVLGIVRNQEIHRIKMSNDEIRYDLKVLHAYDQEGRVLESERKIHNHKVGKYIYVMNTYGGGL